MKEEKVKSIYWFSTGYISHEGSQQTATVILEIEYRAKSYSVKPYCGTVNDGFKFEKQSYDWRKWRAILLIIDEAILFAEKEITNIITLTP